jgi:hypothetical protein
MIVMYTNNGQTVKKYDFHRFPGRGTRRVGNIFGTRLLRTFQVALCLLGVVMTAPVGAQSLLQTLAVRDYFGVSHPDQILDFGLSNSVNPSTTYLLDPGGTEVPYQLLRSNRIAIRGNLPANTEKTWQLMSGRAPASFSGVQLTETSDYYEIVNGLTGVRVVKPTAAGALNLAPIQGIRFKDGRWTATGPNRLYEPSYDAHSTRLLIAAKSMTVSILENGPLKVVVQVSNAYDRPLWQYGPLVIPAGPGFYTSTIELQAGQPSILIEDDTDMEFRYSLNVYDVVQPTQGRYRSHHADRLDLGRKADGSLYVNDEFSDAFRDFDYSVPLYDSYLTADRSGYKLLQRMTAWDRWAYNTGRQYWMLYNSAAAGTAPVIGAFPGRAGRAIGVTVTGPGPFFCRTMARGSVPRALASRRSIGPATTI